MVDHVHAGDKIKSTIPANPTISINCIKMVGEIQGDMRYLIIRFEISRYILNLLPSYVCVGKMYQLLLLINSSDRWPD